jgi:DNA-binding FrmR family transcriptional regulator
LDTIMLALMRIEGKVNSIIGMLESDGQDDD